jgi:anaerobic ribonucleoside-triphosphate reductase activating protein
MMKDLYIKLHSVIDSSAVNGPGDRMVIWTQGCDKGCRGCFNPETWKFEAGDWRSVISLGNDVFKANPDGVTLTGGDPLEQPEALLEFLRFIDTSADSDPVDIKLDLPKGIICFTGYTIEEIFELPGVRGDAARACLDHIDLLIDGRFEEKLRVDHVLAGSSNQRFHFLDKPGRGRDKINPEEVQIDQSVEIHLGKDSLEVTGFPTISRSWLKERGLRILP